MNEEQEQKSIQIRALLAFVLSAAILFLYSRYVVKPQAPKPPAAAVTVTSASIPAPAKGVVQATEPKPTAGASQHAIQSAAQEQTFLVESGNYLVSLSNRGAVVTSWTLKNYQDEIGRPLELVNPAAAPEAGFPFSYAPQSELNQNLFQVESSGGPPASTQQVRLHAPVTLTFRWSDGRVSARKSFRFSDDSYVVQVQSDLTRDGAPWPHLLTWRGGFGDFAVEDSARNVKTFYFDATQNKIIRLDAKAAAKGPVDNVGNYLYAGVEDHYFAAAFLTENRGQPLTLQTTAVEAATSHESKKQPFASAAVGGAGDNRFLVYVGPKSLATLRAIQPQLAQLVDFGFFSFIAYPLFLMLTWTHHWLPNFGWAIVVVTVIINFILFPLKLKSMQSMKKMQRIQPLIKHINDKYKNLSMRDPKRQEQNKEVMELYQKYGVNPLGGCLPMLLQVPFFFAFYAVLNWSIEMRHMSWLWVKDLSAWDHLYLLPIAMVATQFFYQKMTPSTSADPAQQKMMQFMPLIMGFFFYRLPSGLVLYYLTSNLVGILQQWFINRLPEPELETGKLKHRPKLKANR